MSKLPGASNCDAALNTWKLMRPLTIEELDDYWNRVEKNGTPMTCTDTAEYLEWQDDYGDFLQGMRHK